MKRNLASLRDEQIITDELSSERVHPFTKNAYSAIRDRREQGSEQTGVIAERVIAAFFKRLQYDADMDFSFEEADVHQDVHEKIDFIIRRNRRQRNVSVEESDEVPETAGSSGIQFTVNQDEGVISHKLEQIEKAKQRLGSDSEIEDILLVQLSRRASQELRNAYNQFMQSTSSHSVDSYIPSEVRKELFSHVLKDIFSDENIEAQWGRLEA